MLLLDEYATFAMNVRMEEAERRRGKGRTGGKGEERRGKERKGIKRYVCMCVQGEDIFIEGD